jgi:hypothetical protein
VLVWGLAAMRLCAWHGIVGDTAESLNSPVQGLGNAQQKEKAAGRWAGRW